MAKFPPTQLSGECFPAAQQMPAPGRSRQVLALWFPMQDVATMEIYV